MLSAAIAILHIGMTFAVSELADRLSPLKREVSPEKFHSQIVDTAGQRDRTVGSAPKAAGK